MQRKKYDYLNSIFKNNNKKKYNNHFYCQQEFFGSDLKLHLKQIKTPEKKKTIKYTLINNAVFCIQSH